MNNHYNWGDWMPSGDGSTVPPPLWATFRPAPKRQRPRPAATPARVVVSGVSREEIARIVRQELADIVSISVPDTLPE